MSTWRNAAPGHLHPGGGRAIRILLDCTETSGSQSKTGIQRTVRSIVKAGLSLHQSGVEFVPVAFNGIHFDQLDESELLGLPVQAPGRTRTSLLRRFVAHASRIGPLRASLVHPKLLSIGREAAAYTRWKVRRLRASRGSVLRKVNYSSADWIVLLDSNWEPDLRPELQRARSRGARICVVVYDLIKIHTPLLTPPGAAPIFSRYLTRTLPLANRVLAISGTVRDDVLRYLETSNLPPIASPRVGSFHLGSDFGRQGSMPAHGSRSPCFDPALPSFLVLGTIEPRKSQTTILDAFERRWSAGDNAQLVLVGREGWGSHGLVLRLNHHRELGRRLFWLRDASDSELEVCFQHATALINMSISEGFGLPIVEALYRGVPVIASDIPVFREIGTSFTTFVPVEDVEALVRAIATAEGAGVPRPGPGALHVRSWDDSVRDLVAFLADESQ